MTDLQKHPKTATKEQLRLAELIQARELMNTSEDVATQKRVKKVIELTNCTPSVAEVALIDCEGSVEAAVALLLDKPEEIVLWTQQAGKIRKSKSSSMPVANASNNKQFGGQSAGRRVDSQRGGSRFRNGASGEQQQRGGGKENNEDVATQKRVKRVIELTNCTPPVAEVALTNCEGSVEAAVALLEKPEEIGLWTQQAGKILKSKSSTKRVVNASNSKQFGGQSAGRRVDSQRGSRFRNEATVEQQQQGGGEENNADEWKIGQRVWMPSSVTTNSTNVIVNSTSPANATSSWPSLDNNPPVPTSILADLPQQTQQIKPKTFASVAATKKAPPPAPPQPVKRQPSSMSANEGSSTKQSSENKQATQTSVTDMTKNGEEGGVTEWSSAVDWGTATLSPPPAEPSPVRQSLEQQSVAAPEAFGSSGHALNVNQKYTDDLKSVIGLGGSVKSPSGQGQSAPNPVPLNSMDTFQQQISQLSKQSMATTTTGDTTELGKKVEFATGDFPPPVADASAYQFGFQFKEVIPSAASLNDAWSNKPHISSVELDRSMLKDATVNVLSTMTNIPTTSSNVTAHAHFSTTTQQQQQQSHDFQRNSSSRGAALSFTDTASVNYPPANSAGMSMGGGAQANLPPPQQSGGIIPSTAQQQQQQPQQQQQQGKPVYTASNQSMVVNAQQQHLQHLQQQQSQALYHQTSAAAPNAVPQFPSYNMPYMYSPAPALPGQNAELDRFFMQQQYAPYTGLDVQLGAMSLGPPTTLAPSHRNPMDSFMDNKFGPNQQQQSVNQGNAVALQHNQANQQHRGPAQNETNAIFGGSGQVAPPPGFGMATAGAQPSFMPQTANLQSLFQMPTMPTYHPQMSYQHQFMMSNAANRMPNAQRPAQTSPPEGNGHQQRRHDNRGPDSQGYGGNGGADSVDHSAGGGAGSAAAQSYMNKFNYRQYM